jgi:coenzyme F420 hydrogenase subunit beta
MIEKTQVYMGSSNGQCRTSTGEPMKFGPRELLEDVLQRDLCIGCGACVNLCPYFKLFQGAISTLFSCELSDGKCFQYCPRVEVDLDVLSQSLYNIPYNTDPVGVYKSVRISRATNKVGPAPFQTGGTVSALMMFALKKGYIDTAVLTGNEGLLPVPCLVTSPDEVVTCSSSKFTAAPTLAALNQAVNKGYNSIGVVATPCQSLAVAQMKCMYSVPVELTIGLFCMWALDYRPFNEFLSSQVDISKIVRMNIPPPPANTMEIHTGNGKREIPLDDIKPFILNSCSFCFDMTSEFSDISVGLLEGTPGWNTLIIRTDTGNDLVDEAVEEGFLTVKEMPEENLEHLKDAAQTKKKRAFAATHRNSLVNTVNGRASLRVNEETIENIINREGG